MAVTQNSYIGNGSTTNYSFTFPYLKSSEVKAQIDATVTTAFTLANATTVQFNTAPANGAKIKIYRETDTDSLAATFYAGSAIKSEDLNDNFTQNLHTTQEVNARYLSNLGGTMVGDMTMAEDVDIIFEGATDDAYETRLTVADPTADRTITLPNVTGTVVTTGDTGSVTSSMLADATIVAADLASNAVTTAKITDGNVTTAKIAADAVTGAKIANDTINSEHYVDGSIDTAHIADLNVTTAKIAADAITGAKIADDAVDSEHLAADSIDTEHYAPTSVDTAALANTSVTTAKLANDAVTGSQIADNAITSDHLSSNSVVIANMTDNSVGTSELVNDAVTNAKLASGAVDASNIADSTLITNSEQASTTGNDTTLLTSAASDSRYFKQDSTETINSGQTWTSSDNYIATTGAVNARILDLVDDVGGFKTIDNETSFPDTNPDPQNGTGTIISIKGLSTNIVTGSGETTKTISNGNVSNNATITITGLTENTTYGQDMGLLVETTSTTHTYTFHRLVPPPTSITTVSNNINSVNTTAANINTVNDFANKYRIASSAPGSNNDEGDLYYNTNNNRLYVYNGTSWDIATSLNGSGGSVTGDTTFTDGTKLKFGTGEDIQIYHDSGQSYITNSTGNFRIDADHLRLRSKTGTEAFISSSVNGGVELYYDDSKKFETTADGVTVNGDLNLQQPSSTTNYIQWDNSEGKLKLKDDIKITVGDGEDLQIYHDGSNSYIKEAGTGQLMIQADNLILENAAGANYLVGMSGAEVIIYHNDQQKFQTTSSGVDVTGILQCDEFKLLDGEHAKFGTGEDLRIYHDGSHSRIKDAGTGYLILNTDTGVLIKNGADDEGIAYFTPNGAVELMYDNSKKFETTSTGAKLSGNLQLDLGSGNDAYIYNATAGGLVFQADENGHTFQTWSSSWQTRLQITDTGIVNIPDNGKFTAGSSNDLEIYHDGSHSYIANNTGNLYITEDGYIELSSANGGEKYATFNKDGAAELYYDNVKRFDTTSAGISIMGTIEASGNLDVPDWGQLKLGTGDDILIYHTGTDSYFKNTTNDLYIQNTGDDTYIMATDDVYIKTGTDDDWAIKCIGDAGVELYHHNFKSFETHANGITVIGPEGGGGILRLYGDEGDDNADKWDLNANTNGTLLVRNYASGSWENNIIATGNGNVELYYDNAKKFETYADGCIITDGVKLAFGNSEDLQIYHDGSHSYIKDTGTGNFYITGSYLAFMNAAGSEYMIDGSEDGAASLFYDGVNKFQTNANGVTVFGSEGLKLYTENGNNTDTNSIVWRGGSNSQQANVAQIVAKQTSDWGGQLFIKVKKNDGGLSDNYATVLNAKGESNGFVELCTDSSARLQVQSTGFKAGATIPGDHETGGLIINSAGESSLYRSNDGIAFIIGGPQSGQKLVEFRHTSTGIGNISKNGTTGITFNTTNSDRTLKKNFEDWTDSYWTGFKDLKPQKFNFLFQEDSDPKLKGYIAQDLVSTFPEAYPKDAETDKYMFNPSGMVPYLMKTLQEAIIEIETLKTKVAALESS